VMANCPTCSFENSADSNYCRRCGCRLITSDPNETTMTYSATGTGDLDGVVQERTAGTVLLIRSGGGREGETVSLDADVLTVGRSPHSDLFLDDVTVSRHHARVLRDEGGFWVEDLNSLNGTYVNRTRIEQQRLFNRDELQIGKFKLTFVEHIDESPDT
jgi:pSer/pThr/pTyr-binding forkhead associated (FHA) protein